ncbi:MAG TPA: xylulokinase [Fimbriimonadaceae bacterium]|nr:xylulokinase [Fimbriimonadaceae bacterium]
MARLLGIDVGTTSAKAILIDESGRVLASASAEYPLSTPQPLWSEQDPEHWWIGVQNCLQQLPSGPFDAIGLTGQMHGAVFLDGDGEVIRPAILWNDQRTAAECALVEQALGDELLEITLNPMLTGFQAPKILWLRAHEPEAYRRIRSVLLPKDYIRFRLTGELASDVADASGTGLFDVGARKWSERIITALDIDPGWLPRTSECHEVSGRRGDGTPIVAGAGDQAAAAVGTGAVGPGVVSVSLGTSGVVFSALPGPERHRSGAVHTFCHANRGWHAMGVMLACGGALRWYRDVVRRGSSYHEIASAASTSIPGARGVTFLPYLSGERCPHNDSLATACFAGITLSTHARDLDRAVFEGITFGLRDSFHLLEQMGATGDEVRVTGGGARSEFWLQLLADSLGTSCVTLEADEGPAFGAALLAGVGVGVWKDVHSAAADCVRLRKRYDPRSSPELEEPYERFRRLYPALRSWNRKEDE